MTPEEFKKSWTANIELDEELISIAQETLNNLSLKDQTVRFLKISGLPKGAAPLLSFDLTPDENGEIKPRLNDQYSHLDHTFTQYISIGSDGAGNPIVVDSGNNDEVLWLDHENGFSAGFMNSNIEKLAAFLLSYRNFIQRILHENGEDAVMDANFTDLQFKDLENELTKTDPHALKRGTFWRIQLDQLLGDREFYLQEEN